MISLKKTLPIRELIIGGIVALGLVAGTLLYASSTRIAEAVTVAESCYTFETETGHITGYNVAEDPACDVTSLDVPGTISGVTVVGISGSGLSGAGLQSITLPSSLEIVSQAGVSGNALTSLTINTAGDLEITDGNFGTVNGPISIQAAGDLTIRNALSGGVNVSSIAITAGGNLTLAGGTLSNNTGLSTVAVTADGDITLNDGSLGTLSPSTSATVTSTNGNILVQSSSLDSLATPSLAFTSALDTRIIATFQSATGIESVSFVTGGDLLLDDSAFGNASNLTNLLVDVDGDLEFTDGAMSGTKLETFAPSVQGNITISNSALGSNTLLKTLNLVTPGNITYAGSAGNGFSSLESFTARSTSGSVSLGAINGNSSLKTLEAEAATSLTMLDGYFNGLSALQEVTLTADQNMVIGNGTLLNNPIVHTVTLTAGTTMSFGAGSFSSSWLLENVTINATSTSFSSGAFSKTPKIATITLPNVTSIGAAAFSEGNFEAVYIGGTPTIDPTAFSSNGVTSIVDLDTGTTYDTTNLSYVPIYTLNPSNPGNFTSRVTTPYDYDNDGTDEPSGGIIINPASFQQQYRDSQGNALQSSFTSVGETSPGNYLTSYLVSANPTQNFGLYYQVGDSFTVIAPAIAGYITPAPQTGTYSAGLNQINFVYVPIGGGSTNPDAPNTGIASSKMLPITITALIAGLAIISGLIVYAVRSKK